MLGGGVVLLVGCLPLGPRALGGRQFVPTFGYVGLVVGGNHGTVGSGNKDGAADGEVGPLGLCLGFLINVYVVGDAFIFFVEGHHLTLDSDGAHFVETAAIIT